MIRLQGIKIVTPTNIAYLLIQSEGTYLWPNLRSRLIYRYITSVPGVGYTEI